TRRLTRAAGEQALRQTPPQSWAQCVLSISVQRSSAPPSFQSRREDQPAAATRFGHAAVARAVRGPGRIRWSPPSILQELAPRGANGHQAAPCVLRLAGISFWQNRSDIVILARTESRDRH